MAYGRPQASLVSAGAAAAAAPANIPYLPVEMLLHIFGIYLLIELNALTEGQQNQNPQYMHRYRTIHTHIDFVCTFLLRRLRGLNGQKANAKVQREIKAWFNNLLGQSFWQKRLSYKWDVFATCLHSALPYAYRQNIFFDGMFTSTKSPHIKETYRQASQNPFLSLELQQVFSSWKDKLMPVLTAVQSLVANFTDELQHDAHFRTFFSDTAEEILRKLTNSSENLLQEEIITLLKRSYTTHFDESQVIKKWIEMMLKCEEIEGLLRNFNTILKTEFNHPAYHHFREKMLSLHQLYATKGKHHVAYSGRYDWGINASDLHCLPRCCCTKRKHIYWSSFLCMVLLGIGIGMSAFLEQKGENASSNTLWYLFIALAVFTCIPAFILMGLCLSSAGPGELIQYIKKCLLAFNSEKQLASIQEQQTEAIAAYQRERQDAGIIPRQGTERTPLLGEQPI